MQQRSVERLLSCLLTHRQKLVARLRIMKKVVKRNPTFLCSWERRVGEMSLKVCHLLRMVLKNCLVVLNCKWC